MQMQCQYSMRQWPVQPTMHKQVQPRVPVPMPHQCNEIASIDASVDATLLQVLEQHQHKGKGGCICAGMQAPNIDKVYAQADGCK